MRRFFIILLGVCWVAGSLQAAPVKNLSDVQRIEVLERRIGKLTELMLRLDALEQDNRQLQGEIETLNHRIGQMQRKQRDIYADIDQRLGNVKPITPAPMVLEQPKPTTTDPQKVGVPDKPANPAVSGKSADPAKIHAEYDAAYALLSPAQRQYPQAITAFKTFLQKYPQDKLAANAQYWLAEAYYVTQDNPPALQAFTKVVSGYPDSTKAAGAWYKIGKIEQADKRWDMAAKAYQTVIDLYPQSSAAGLAKKALASLPAQKN